MAISRVRNISSAYRWNDAIVCIMQRLYFSLIDDYKPELGDGGKYGDLGFIR